jgi:C-terminal processing protease CtpA/Prc
MLMISNRGYRTSRGTIVEGHGVAPDFVVRPSRADLIAGRDPVLDAARELLDTRRHAVVPSQ